MPRFFHGGIRGLGVSDFVLPATETGTWSVSGAFGAPYRRDRVYVTTDLTAARSYAALVVPPAVIATLRQGPSREVIGRLLAHLGGAVYEVEPVGHLVCDSDEASHSFEALRARIRRVVEPEVPVDLQSLGLRRC